MLEHFLLPRIKQADRKDSDGGSRLSEVEITDDDTMASDDATCSRHYAVAGESIPNSPASLAHRSASSEKFYICLLHLIV